MDKRTRRQRSTDSVFLKNYKLGKTLGIGSFGKVKAAEHKLTGHKVAIKILNRRKIAEMAMEDKVEREIKILKLFMHPHIIRLYEVIDTPTETDIYLVMEYAESGELYDYIVERGRLQEHEARRLFQQIISGVEFCHRNRVVHRDLKPENMLLDSKFNVKIADFNLSNIMYDGRLLKTSCGSRTYAAPEIIYGKLYAGPEVDVWSCGVILYALLCGVLPFEHENIAILYHKIKNGIYTLPCHLSPAARSLISEILVVDPLKRITLHRIHQHPWFQVHLPRYIAAKTHNTIQAEKMDEAILQKVVLMGFNRNQLIEYLCNKQQNEATVTYYLLLGSQSSVSGGYLAAEQEFMESGIDRTHSNNATALSLGHTTGYTSNQVMGLRPQLPIDRRWTLGLQSKADPRDIMMEVLKTLLALNVYWKKIGYYNIKCRFTPDIPSHSESIDTNLASGSRYVGDDSISILNDAVTSLQIVVKFEIQLYKSQEKYLLDLHRVQGPQFLFLNLCSTFLSQLQVI